MAVSEEYLKALEEQQNKSRLAGVTPSAPALQPIIPQQTFEIDREAENYLAGLYDAQARAKQSALESAYQQNVNALQAQREQLPQQYEAARNQVAGQSEVERQKWNEYAASSGLNAGASGQAQLAFSGQLQGNLANINRAQSDALSQVDLQATQLQSKYKSDVATAIAEGDFAKAQALYNNYQADRDRMIQQQQQQANLMYNYAVLQNTKENQSLGRESDEYNKNYSIAANAAELSGDYSGMGAYGWTPEQIAAVQQEWQRQRSLEAAKVYNSRVAATSTPSKPRLTAGQAWDAYLSGTETPEVLSALEYYYGSQDPYGISTEEVEPPANTATGAGRNTVFPNASSLVTNANNASDWISVAGFGRLTWAELLRAVESGEIEESYNPQTGKYSYRKAKSTSGGGGTQRLSAR